MHMIAMDAFRIPHIIQRVSTRSKSLQSARKNLSSALVRMFPGSLRCYREGTEIAQSPDAGTAVLWPLDGWMMTLPTEPKAPGSYPSDEIVLPGEPLCLAENGAEPSGYRIRAISDLCLIVLGAEDWQFISTTDIQFHHYTKDVAALRLQRRVMREKVFANTNPLARVAFVLLEVASRLPLRRLPAHVAFQMPSNQIAVYAGLTREDVETQIEILCNSGIIQFESAGHLTIRSPDILAFLANADLGRTAVKPS